MGVAIDEKRRRSACPWISNRFIAWIDGATKLRVTAVWLVRGCRHKGFEVRYIYQYIVTRPVLLRDFTIRCNGSGYRRAGMLIKEEGELRGVMDMDGGILSPDSAQEMGYGC